MIYNVLWLATIVGGVVLSTVVPDSFMYITGFIAGTVSFMFLRLEKEK